jgi:hypothetical protein
VVEAGAALAMPASSDAPSVTAILVKLERLMGSSLKALQNCLAGSRRPDAWNRRDSAEKCGFSLV